MKTTKSKIYNNLITVLETVEVNLNIFLAVDIFLLLN